MVIINVMGNEPDQLVMSYYVFKINGPLVKLWIFTIQIYKPISKLILK